MGSSPPTPASRRPVKIFFDGGARPNPGRIEIAVVARGVVRVVDDAGTGDNNAAEWSAAKAALATAKDLGGAAILLGDSEHALARARRDPDFAHVRLRKVKRAQNLAGIALAARRR